jgi:hypothetical protein
VLVIIQMVGGALVNFSLEAPLFGPPGFLVNAAPHSTQIALGALLGVALEALWIAIAVTAFPFLYEGARPLALWFGALAAVILAVAVAEAATVMSMISVSDAYTKANPAGQEQLQTFRVIVASARNWAHYLGRIVDGAAIFVFYAVLFRLALVPRAIAGFGLIAAPLMIAGIGVSFFGHTVVFPLLAPLGLSQLLLAGWLIAKGFRAAP